MTSGVALIIITVEAVVVLCEKREKGENWLELEWVVVVVVSVVAAVPQMSFGIQFVVNTTSGTDVMNGHVGCFSIRSLDVKIGHSQA